MNKKIVDIEIYNTYIELIWNTKREEVHKYLKKKYKYEIDLIGYRGCTFSIKDTEGFQFHILYLDKRLKRNELCEVVAHELIHIINSIFIRIGYKLDPSNDESSAYLMSYLIRNCLKHVNI